MGRSLLILAVLTAAVVLVRPPGPRQTDGPQGWSWLAIGLALQALRVRVLSLHVACSRGDLLVATGCLLTLGEELWRSARASRRLRTDGRLRLEGPQSATVKGG